MRGSDRSGPLNDVHRPTSRRQLPISPLTPFIRRTTVRSTGGGDVLTVRLPENLERELDRIAAEERTPKTQIVRRALERYMTAHRDRISSFELGEDLFGRFGSGDGTLSSTYK